MVWEDFYNQDITIEVRGVTNYETVTNETDLKAAADKANGFKFVEKSITDFTADNYNVYLAEKENLSDGDNKFQVIAKSKSEGSGNAYWVKGIKHALDTTYEDVETPTLIFRKGVEYTITYPSSHPFKVSTTSDGTWESGVEVGNNIAVTSVNGDTYKITIKDSYAGDTLYYYCNAHSGMGGKIIILDNLDLSNAKVNFSKNHIFIMKQTILQ